MRVNSQFFLTVDREASSRVANRILAISRTVEGLGAAPRVSIEIYLLSKRILFSLG
jgi:hypothetical protein